MLNDIIQFIVAIVVITLLGIIAYSIYNAEMRQFAYSLTQTTNVKKEVIVFQGIVGDEHEFSYNTQDKRVGNYKELSPSINQSGGAEYTYNFWMFIPEESNNRPGGSSGTYSIPLFLRGSNITSKYKENMNCDINASNGEGWYLVKNPLVKAVIKNGSVDGVVVEYNSIVSPDVYHANPDSNNCGDDTRYNNMLGIHGFNDRTDIRGKWNMLTLVVQETNPSSDILFRNQAIVKMYLNGYEYLDKHAEMNYNGDSSSTAMKHNKGRLYMFPKKHLNSSGSGSGSGFGIQMADLTYYNYAIEKDKVLRLFKGGFTEIGATIPNENNISINSDKSNIDYQKSETIKEY